MAQNNNKIQDLLYFKGKLKPNNLKLNLVNSDDFNDKGIIVSIFN